MSSFLYGSFRGGIDDIDDKGREGGAQLVKGADIRKKRDTLSCQQALVEVSTPAVTVSDLVKHFVPASDGNMYGFGDSGKIYKITSAGVISVVYTDANGAIKGATQWYIDNSKKYLFWATDTRLNSKELPGQADWSDVNASITNANLDVQTYPKSNLTSATSHIMRNINGSLLICNGQYVALVGYDASYTNNALNLLPDLVARTIEEYGKDAVIGTARTDSQSKASLIWWDQLSTNWNEKRSVPFKSINTIMLESEVPLMQVDTDGRMMYVDSVKRPPLFSLEGGQTNPDGKDVFDGMLHFGVYGATSGYNGIYSYGRKDLSHDVVLSLDYPLEVDEIGAVKMFGSDLYLSYKTGSSYGFKKVDTTTKAVAHYYSRLVKAQATGLKNDANWQNIVIECDALPANCTIEAYFRIDKQGDYVQARLSDNSLVFNTTGGKKAVFLTGGTGNLHEFYLKLTPYLNTTPEITRVLVGFQ
jgi:hypothetical protein